MKRRILCVIIVVAAGCGFLPHAYGDSDDAKPAEKKEAAEETAITRDTNGNAVVKISAETQKLMGLKTESLAAAQLAPELKAYGRVLEPAPLAAIMGELAAAQAASAASSNELARLKTLSGSGNASARALQAAEVNALHDQLATQSARDRLVASYGKEVAAQNDMPAFIQSLTALDSALVRLDLPAGRRMDAPPATARVTGLAGNSAEAQVLGPAMSVDPQTQGQGFILQISPNQPRFLPGEAVTGYLKTPGEALAGVIIPRDAVIRTDGKGWVYVAAGEKFTRKEIALDRATDNGWFVTNGVMAGEVMVTTGAQSLLSEEQKAALGPPD